MIAVADRMRRFCVAHRLSITFAARSATAISEDEGVSSISVALHSPIASFRMSLTVTIMTSLPQTRHSDSSSGRPIFAFHRRFYDDFFYRRVLFHNKFIDDRHLTVKTKGVTNKTKRSFFRHVKRPSSSCVSYGILPSSQRFLAFLGGLMDRSAIGFNDSKELFRCLSLP